MDNNEIFDLNEFVKYLIVSNFYDNEDIKNFLTPAGQEAWGTEVKVSTQFINNPASVESLPNLKLKKGDNDTTSGIIRAFQKKNRVGNKSKYFNYEKLREAWQSMTGSKKEQIKNIAQSLNNAKDINDNIGIRSRIFISRENLTDAKVAPSPRKTLMGLQSPVKKTKGLRVGVRSQEQPMLNQPIKPNQQNVFAGRDFIKNFKNQVEDDPLLKLAPEDEDPILKLAPEDAPQQKEREEKAKPQLTQEQPQDAPVDAPVQPQLTQQAPARTSELLQKIRNALNQEERNQLLNQLDDLIQFEIPDEQQVIEPDVRDLLPEATRRSRAGVAQGATRRSREQLQRMIESGQAKLQGVDIFDVEDGPEFEPRLTQDQELLQPEGTVARTANRIFQSIAQGLTRELPNLLINSGNNLDRLQMDVRNRVGRRAAALDFTTKIGLNILFNLVASLVATWYNTTYTPEEPVKQVEPVPTEEPTEKPKEGSPETKIEDDLRQLLQEPIKTDIVKQEPLIVQVQPEPDIINVDAKKNKERYNKFAFNESKNKDNNPLVDLNELNENLRFFKNYINYNLETKKIFGEYTKPNELGKRISGTTTNIKGAPNYIAFNPRVENLGSNFETDPHQSIKDWFSRDQGALDVERYANFQF